MATPPAGPVVGLAAAPAARAAALAWLRTRTALLAGATLACDPELQGALAAAGWRLTAVPDSAFALPAQRLVLAVVLEHPLAPVSRAACALTGCAQRDAAPVAATTSTADLLLGGGGASRHATFSYRP